MKTQINPLAVPLANLRRGRSNYEKEYKYIEDILGKPMPTVSNTKEGATTGANNNLLKYKSLTLAK